MFLRDNLTTAVTFLRAPNIIPDDLIFQNPVFRPEMNGQGRAPRRLCPYRRDRHRPGSDADNFIVLEDNARTALRRLLHAGKTAKS